MNVVLEYISTNYTWILFVLIIILLAVIGWYADKTNFGQGKKIDENQDDNGKSIDDLKRELGNKKLSDEINGNQSLELTNNNKSVDENINTEQDIKPTIVINNAIVQPIQSIEQLQSIPVENNNIVNKPITKENFNQQEVEMNFDPITGEPINNVSKNISSSSPTETVNDVGVESSENIDIIFDENLENFEKKFNEVIPEKETIDEGLLEDIENLTLDKTQKIDLNDIPDLDDVDLPRIRQMKTNDEGVWKF